VTDLVRATTIQVGHAKIHTVEHVLSALHGCGIDNVFIEMDASEPPIHRRFGQTLRDLIMQGEPVEQDKEREYFTLDAAVSVTRGQSSIIALPCDELRITCTSADDRGIHTQHLSLTIDPDAYMTQVAAARTFTIYEDIEELLKLGKIKGGSLDCAVVIKGDKIISKEAAALQGRVRPSQDPRYHRRRTAARPAAEGAHHRHAARSCDQRRADEDPLRAKLQERKKGPKKRPPRPPRPRSPARPRSISSACWRCCRTATRS
jgi:hypothetical protein